MVVCAVTREPVSEACDVNCNGLKAIVSHSMTQAEYTNQGKSKITFGPSSVRLWIRYSRHRDR